MPISFWRLFGAHHDDTWSIISHRCCFRSRRPSQVRRIRRVTIGSRPPRAGSDALNDRWVVSAQSHLIMLSNFNVDPLTTEDPSWGPCAWRRPLRFRQCWRQVCHECSCNVSKWPPMQWYLFHCIIIVNDIWCVLLYIVTPSARGSHGLSPLPVQWHSWLPLADGVTLNTCINVYIICICSSSIRRTAIGDRTGCVAAALKVWNDH